MVKNVKQISEEKTTAASYILNFYQIVQSINHHYANYLNQLILMENASKDKSKEVAENLNIGNRAQLIEMIQSIRYYRTQAYIAYSTIMKGVNKAADSEIKDTYLKIISQLVINRNDLETYVIAMNTSLMKDIIKRLMESSQDVLSNLMASQPKENAPE